MPAQAILLSPTDDVAIVPDSVAAGDLVTVEGRGEVEARSAVPAGHKISIAGIAEGQVVRKYGSVIGLATAPIEAGDHVHTHNLGFTSDRVRDVAGGPSERPRPGTVEERTWSGYRRDDGRVGTRNYIGVLTTVNCSATASKLAVRQAVEGGVVANYQNLDGVVALTHTTGCCIDGYGLELLQRTLRGYLLHPNFGGVVMVGLGCEVNQLDEVLAGVEATDGRQIVNLEIQDVGGTAATVEMVRDEILSMAPRVAESERSAAGLADLVVAMECGGSDAYSGLTANPAAGFAGDVIAAAGGSFVFGETPEIYGAEHLLLARASDGSVADALARRIRWWEDYVASNGTTINNNPTPGNKEGGITTILEKSLGAVAKGGTSRLEDVLEYAQPVVKPGLSFMDTPGYDPVSVTGMVAGGANVVVFTTGRGSVFGCKPVPSIKVATNTPMYQRMEGDMDLNAGTIFDGGLGVEDVGMQLLDLVIETASGRLTKSEMLGLGDEEFTPWQIGAVV